MLENLNKDGKREGTKRKISSWGLKDFRIVQWKTTKIRWQWSVIWGWKWKQVKIKRKAQQSKYISILCELILITPCMVYTMKQLPQIIGTSSSTCMLCLQVKFVCCCKIQPQKAGFFTWGWDGTMLSRHPPLRRASGEFQIWKFFYFTLEDLTERHLILLRLHWLTLTFFLSPPSSPSRSHCMQELCVGWWVVV